MDEIDKALALFMCTIFVVAGLLIAHFEAKLQVRSMACKAVGGHLIPVDRDHLCVRSGLIVEGY